MRGKDGFWLSYSPNSSQREEPVASRKTESPAAKQALPAGHFRLNQTQWDLMRQDADMRTVRQVIVDDTDFSWFARLAPKKQDEVYDEIVAQPLLSMKLHGLEDLHTGAILAMAYPLHDVWANAQVQDAVQEAQTCEGTFRAALARHVSAETWAQWSDEA